MPPQVRVNLAAMITTLLILATLTLSADTNGQPTLPIEPLAIEVAPGKTHKFKVEMAITPETMAVGMMFRKSAPPGTGMLFDYGSVRDRVTFWMRNTLIPLDMIFINGQGNIVRVATAIPLDESPVPSGAPTRAVLEIAGGEAARLGVKPGQRVRQAIFGDKLPH